MGHICHLFEHIQKDIHFHIINFNQVPTHLIAGAIRSVAVSQNSKYFASASYDKTVRLWITRDVECINVLEGR